MAIAIAVRPINHGCRAKLTTAVKTGPALRTGVYFLTRIEAFLKPQIAADEPESEMVPRIGE
jgi:hypothetical protein